MYLVSVHLWSQSCFSIQCILCALQEGSIEGIKLSMTELKVYSAMNASLAHLHFGCANELEL